MNKFISILFFALLLCTHSATASEMTYISDGQFYFSLLVKHSSYVSYAKLDLFFQDFARLKKAMVFDDITITSIGQTFDLTKTDNEFAEAAAFLTNGLPDWINVSLITPTRTSFVEATEPAALFGDASGSSGIDLASWSIESITLQVTDLVFIYGFEYGAYTNITVRGVVNIGYDSPPVLDANFIATPNSGVAPLTVQFTDESTGAVDSWNWTFGDGDSSTERAPSHTYTAEGTYTVELTVTDADGNVATETEYISVAPSPEYTLSVNSDNGSVTLDPDKASYNEGDTVTLIAFPDAGYEFTGWSGDASGSSLSITVTMTEDKTVTANFIPCLANTIILTSTSPDHTITSGSDDQVYGTATSNQITLESGAIAELINFPGQNNIQIQSGSDLFTVSRAGTVVTFQGSDGTALKIPATTDVQTISFNGEENRVLQIYNNRVMLDDQVITTTSAPIENNQVTSGGVIKSSVLYDADPVYSSADQAALVSGFNHFSLDFYHALKTQPSLAGKNFFFSSYSIENALAMTWAGAENQTADQMADVLHFNLSQDFLHSTLNGLNIDINSRDDEPPPSGDPFSLNSVNAVWSRIGYPFVQDYLDVMATNYDAGIRTLDFMGDPDGSRQIINQWVEDQTNEKIKDLLPPESISPLTAVVLTNAIYFKGSWYEKFDADRTAPGPFTLLDGTVVTAELMHRETDTRYYRGSSFDAVELPYASPAFSEYEYPQELAMLVIVPHNGVFESVEGSLDKSGIDTIVESLSMGTVDVTVPKFEFESETKCKDILTGLGMTDAFEPFLSDFSGMVSPIDSKPWIDEIYHKAFVAVDENGTEAAAATAVVMADTSIPEVINISADKPFIFLIYDHVTRTILFMGRVLDPTFSG